MTGEEKRLSNLGKPHMTTELPEWPRLCRDMNMFEEVRFDIATDEPIHASLKRKRNDLDQPEL